MSYPGIVIADIEPAALASDFPPEQQLSYSIAVSLKRIADHFERQAPPPPPALRGRN